MEDIIVNKQEIILDKDFIKDTVKILLHKSHSNSQKKEIHPFSDRLNFACPICGDSEKIASKKRGNLYYRNLMYKCYNCGKYESFIKLTSDFGIQIDIDKKLQLYNYIDNNTYYTKENDDYVINKLDKLIDLDTLIDFYNNHPEHKIINIRPIKKGSAVYEYLTLERNIHSFENLYEGTFIHKPKWKEPIVIILNKHNNKVIGMQVRNIQDDKKKRFYKIYDFEDIYNVLHPNELLDELEAISYNKLSHFINILNVDFSRPVTIFEGYFDSMFFPNSIGVIGVNTDLTFLLKDKSLNLRFFYDNDKDGYKAANKMLNEGYKVFLWKLLFKNILKNKKDKDTAQKRLEKIKDLNKLAIETKTMPYELLKLENYFSKDKFDMIYLDNKTNLINFL